MEVATLKADEAGTAMISLNDSTIETPPPDSDSIINAHQNTWRVYRWQTNGTKALKRDDGTQIWRIHYRCSNWNKPETASGCKARFSEDFLTKDKRNSLGPKKFRPIQHNHPPPTRTTLDQDIIDEIGNQARQGRKSSAIEKSILNSTPAEDLTKSYRLPSRKQIQNEIQKVRNADVGFLRLDTIKQTCMQSDKIIARYGKTTDHFLHHFALFPEVRIVLAPPKGLELLAQHGQFAVLDGTFELAELGMVVATVLVYVGGVLVPVAWMISDTIAIQNYEWFLRCLQTATGGQWGLGVCFSDFEPALRSAITQVFPGCLILGDSWHFFHENHKWVRANGGMEYLEAIDQSLHILWAAPTEQEFTTSMAGFVNYWATVWNPYVTYFSKTWLESGPAEWAMFGRAPELPQCDYQFESYASRLLLAGVRSKTPVDLVVNDLYMEWYYFTKLLSSPDMLAERLKDIEANTQKHTKLPSMHEWIASRPSIPLALPFSSASSDLTSSDSHVAPAYQSSDTLTAADPNAATYPQAHGPILHTIIQHPPTTTQSATANLAAHLHPHHLTSTHPTLDTHSTSTYQVVAPFSNVAAPTTSTTTTTTTTATPSSSSSTSTSTPSTHPPSPTQADSNGDKPHSPPTSTSNQTASSSQASSHAAPSSPSSSASSIDSSPSQPTQMQL